MLELYQAEWCPHSHRVRQRLTELGIDFVARQVAPEPDDRDAMEEATGRRSIPTLLLEDGSAVEGDDAILAHLSRTYDEPAAAAAHREKDAEEGPAWRGDD
jgi:glutaredoxin 3